MSNKSSVAKSLIGGLFGGLIVIWVGVSLYFVMSEVITWGQWSAYFCLGMAGLFILQGIAWLAIPGMRRSFIGMLIPAVFLSVVGLVPILGGGWHAWGVWWPLMLVAVGLVIIVSTVWGVLSKHRKKEEETK